MPRKWKWYLAVGAGVVMVGGCYIVARLGHSWGDLLVAGAIACWVGILWSDVSGIGMHRGQGYLLDADERWDVKTPEALGWSEDAKALPKCRGDEGMRWEAMEG